MKEVCRRYEGASPVDVLKILELSDTMEGVSLEAGFCTNRQGKEEVDLAYKIDKKIQISVPTQQLFPGEEVKEVVRVEGVEEVVRVEEVVEEVVRVDVEEVVRVDVEEVTRSFRLISR
ncbi:hypothetical protein QTP86_032246 [Hemibagrus guttatus]|nr:hypothetical protein QTP86_032246 [Hemibagrus guttatus]